MADVLTAEMRSLLMSRMGTRDTRPEIALRHGLWHLGFRYRLHARELPGRPDIVLPKWKAAIFVHGCFWHRHKDCRFSKIPGTRVDFWTKKLGANVCRDNRNVADLRRAGWRVAVVWECSLRKDPVTTCRLVSDWIRSGTMQLTVARSEDSISAFGELIHLPSA